MSIYIKIQEKIQSALSLLSNGAGIELPQHLVEKIVVEPTKDAAHGDLATNAAMVLSKPFKVAPKKLALMLIEHLSADTDFMKLDCAGPGFINITLNKKLWLNELATILSENEAYGNLSLGANKTINVEFVSANPTGPMHTGHGRNAVLGDVVASLLQKSGYNVTREYYINDAGGQVKTLAQSVYLRYLTECGESVEDDAYQGKYPGDYLIPVAKDLYAKYGRKFVNTPENKWLALFQDDSVSAMMLKIQTDLKRLGIVMDVYTSEKSIVEENLIQEVLNILTAKGDIYTGVLEKPKMLDDAADWEERPQTLFRATKYGDDFDRALKKSDGSWTYFAGDLAYHLHKHRRNFDHLLNIFGCDHIGYIKRLKSAVSAISGNPNLLEVKASQLVNFLENGTPIRMSKRSGNFITIEDVVKRVGTEATRFMMVSRHQDMTIDFDFKKVIEESKDNPMFYIQYAHARIYSVLRHAHKKITDDVLKSSDFSNINDPLEMAVLKKACEYPRQIEIAARCIEPHRICTYLYDLAGLFHSLWNAGKSNNQLRFIDENNEKLTLSRLALISGVATVLSSGLKLLGITPVEEMR
ncbi:MAG: arginine--tRNA ligase [Alphaproteobacteria bacterium CG_4_10_14_0_8_um_filter_37_21]|nr:MAG: arginine--tRNA ligase [Alphaproteobacteria bacterium CG_4_10_14_0_8_um_filter_37_21]